MANRLIGLTLATEIIGVILDRLDQVDDSKAATKTSTSITKSDSNTDSDTGSDKDSDTKTAASNTKMDNTKSDSNTDSDSGSDKDSDTETAASNTESAASNTETAASNTETAASNTKKDNTKSDSNTDADTCSETDSANTKMLTETEDTMVEVISLNSKSKSLPSVDDSNAATETSSSNIKKDYAETNTRSVSKGAKTDLTKDSDTKKKKLDKKRKKHQSKKIHKSQSLDVSKPNRRCESGSSSGTSSTDSESEKFRGGGIVTSEFYFLIVRTEKANYLNRHNLLASLEKFTDYPVQEGEDDKGYWMEMCYETLAEARTWMVRLLHLGFGSPMKKKKELTVVERTLSKAAIPPAPQPSTSTSTKTGRGRGRPPGPYGRYKKQ